MTINPDSRILLFAPHPDDETLGTGGVLQRAVHVGATVRVVFVTNGDDNPWPQRLLERKWKIQITDRMLWGMRRAQEALEALTVLGVPARCVEFLNLPDQRLTDLLLKASAQVIERLAHTIEELQPTFLLAPSPFDLHPDHSALHLLVQCALARARRPNIEQLCFTVHGRDHLPGSIAIELTPLQQQQKRRAVLCHRTQIALSRKRFLRHARQYEEFWPGTRLTEVERRHPIREFGVTDDVLHLQLERRRASRSFGRCTLLLMARHGAIADCWRARLRYDSGKVKIYSPASGRVTCVGDLAVRGLGAELRIRLPWTRSPMQFFAKLEEPTIFFDRAGWRELPCPQSKFENRPSSTSAPLQVAG